jgi:tetratricopeptide (TPR) repeat protein
MLALALAAVFTLEGRVSPPARAAITLHGAVTPFNASLLSGPDGRFVFRKLEPGAYTLEAFVPGAGSVRRTVEIGAAQAGPSQTVRAVIAMDDPSLRPDRSGGVAFSQLSVPDKAKSLYSSALRRLARRDVAGATRDLEQAVAFAPQYADAWNHLGTIRYQTAQYAEAEKCFRAALEGDLNAYAPLVNLGGVLLNLNRPEEALRYNRYATLREPSDALAHSQLGMTFFLLGRFDLAEKSLREAIRLDAAHFSHPQLVLAEMYVQQRRFRDAEAQLEEFLQLHPGDPKAAATRESLKQLRQRI